MLHKCNFTDTRILFTTVWYIWKGNKRRSSAIYISISWVAAPPCYFSRTQYYPMVPMNLQVSQFLARWQSPSVDFFKNKLQKVGEIKMGFFMDWCLLPLMVVFSSFPDRRQVRPHLVSYLRPVTVSLNYKQVYRDDISSSYSSTSLERLDTEVEDAYRTFRSSAGSRFAV